MENRIITGDEPKYSGLLGMPIELEIAKVFMAAHITGCVYAGFPYKSEEVAIEALKDANALLIAYNNQKHGK